MRLRTTLLVFILLAPALAYSQASFFEKGRSGVGFYAGVSNVEQTGFYNASVVVTASGRFDVGFSLASLELDGGDFYSFGLSIEYYFLRLQSEHSDVLMNLSAIGAFTGFDTPDNAAFYGGGFGLSVQTSPEAELAVAPSINLVKFWPKDERYKSETVIGVASPFVFNIREHIKFSIVPSLSIGSEFTTKSILAGFTLVSKKMREL